MSVLPEKIWAQDGDKGINEKIIYSIKLGKSLYFLLEFDTVIQDDSFTCYWKE